jgi:hypothetical protein
VVKVTLRSSLSILSLHLLLTVLILIRSYVHFLIPVFASVDLAIVWKSKLSDVVPFGCWISFTGRVVEIDFYAHLLPVFDDPVHHAVQQR